MGFNILIVDDSATTRGVMAKTIRLADVPIGELHEAANGEEALKVLNKTWIDCVFTDINMPVMDGIQLVERMRADGLLKTIPVILVTIEGSKTRIDNLKAKGVSGFVRKPFTPEHIRTVLNHVMSPKIQHDYAPAAAKSLKEVLERFAFMFSEPVEKDDMVAPPERARRAIMRFVGQLSGTVSMAVPTAMCGELAANYLGVEEKDPLATERGEDALKELINVVCGQTLTSIVGSEPMFDLSVPTTEKIAAEEWKLMAEDRDTQVFMVDDHPVLLQFSVEEHG